MQYSKVNEWECVISTFRAGLCYQNN